MTDPSSQNPFDPAKGPDQGTTPAGGEKPKLKLKQLLTPLSPHLKVEPQNEESQQETNRPKRKLEIPRAVPQEPKPDLPSQTHIPSVEDSPAVTPIEPVQPKLTQPPPPQPKITQTEQQHPKLTPPDIPPSFDNIPHAVPFEEEELQLQEGHPDADGFFPSQKGMIDAPRPAGMPPVQQPGMASSSVQEPVPGTAAGKPGEEEKVESLVSAPVKEQSRLRKVGLPVVALLLIIAAIHHFFDPLGLSIEPITPQQPVVLDEPVNTVQDKETTKSMASVNLTLELDKMTVESFIGKIGEMEIIPIQNPRGAIIDSVLYPEGSSINPMLGLVLSSVRGSEKDATIQIADADGKIYEIKAN